MDIGGLLLLWLQSKQIVSHPFWRHYCLGYRGVGGRGGQWNDGEALRGKAHVRQKQGPLRHVFDLKFHKCIFFDKGDSLFPCECVSNRKFEKFPKRFSFLPFRVIHKTNQNMTAGFADDLFEYKIVAITRPKAENRACLPQIE